MYTSLPYHFVLLLVAVSLSINIIAAPIANNNDTLTRVNSSTIGNYENAWISAGKEARASDKGVTKYMYSSNDSAPTESKRTIKSGSKVKVEIDDKTEGYDATPIFAPPKDIKGDPSILLLDKMMTKSCLAETKNRRDDISTTVPSTCSLQIHEGSELILKHKEDSPPAHGVLGNTIGEGAYGVVFDVQAPGWSTRFRGATPTVAKWFKYKKYAIAELLNLQAIGELVYYGVSGEVPNRSLWAVMEKKRGATLPNLPSGSYYRARGDEGECKDYMLYARNAVVAAHHSYMRMPGAPTHGDLHQGNVLFLETKIDGNIELEASLVDWGKIDWRLARYDKATEDQLEHIENKLTEELEDGYIFTEGHGKKPDYFDFSDANNCFPSNKDAEGASDVGSK